MADKSHINPATGRTGKCRATKSQRPFGGEDDHYATREAAQAAFEREQAFATLAKVTSSSHKSVMQQELAALMVAREEALELQYSSFERVSGPLGGYTWKLAISREAYESRKENAEDLTRQADEKARELRAFKTVPRWKRDFPQAKNLEQARSEVMHSLNKSGDKEAFFAEFAPGEHRQAAETLGYFMSAARKGDLETDEELVAMLGRRDWRVILSEQIPGYAEWAAQRDEEEKEKP